MVVLNFLRFTIQFTLNICSFMLFPYYWNFWSWIVHRLRNSNIKLYYHCRGELVQPRLRHLPRLRVQQTSPTATTMRHRTLAEAWSTRPTLPITMIVSFSLHSLHQESTLPSFAFFDKLFNSRICSMRKNVLNTSRLIQILHPRNCSIIIIQTPVWFRK